MTMTWHLLPLSPSTFIYMPNQVSPLKGSIIDRIGRTGRVGNTGSATSFYDRGKDGGLARPLLDILAEAQQVFVHLLNSNIWIWICTIDDLLCCSQCQIGWRRRRDGILRAIMELEVVKDLEVGTSGHLLDLDSTTTAQDLALLRQANLWREMMDGTSRAAFLGNCHIFLVWYSLYLA